MSSAGLHASVHRSSRRSTASGSSWGSETFLAHIPCLQAFTPTALFPRSDFGPVDALAFLRLMALRSSGDSFIAVRLPVGAGPMGGGRPSLSHHRDSHLLCSYDLGLMVDSRPRGVGKGGLCGGERSPSLVPTRSKA